MRDSTGQESSEITTMVGHDAGADDRGEDQQEDHRRQRHGEIDERMAMPSTKRPPKAGDGADEEADDESRSRPR